jgi:hypothetical protein
VDHDLAAALEPADVGGIGPTSAGRFGEVGPEWVAVLAATDSEPVAHAAEASAEEAPGRVERTSASVRTES